MERIAMFAVGAEPHVRRMGLHVILRVVAFRFDVASPVLSWPAALLGKAIPYAWVEYLSRHTLPIMPGYVKNPFPVPDRNRQKMEVLAITGITLRETGTPGNGARFEITVPDGAFRIKDSVPGR
jgi:hypothetical protein